MEQSRATKKQGPVFFCFRSFLLASKNEMGGNFIQCDGQLNTLAP
jgi:hypothetical protein